MTNWSVTTTLMWLAPSRSDATGSRSYTNLRDSDNVQEYLSRDGSAEEQRSATVINGTASDILIERIRDGDEVAFSDLYLAFYDRLWRLAVVLGEPPESGQELVQEIFLSLWARRQTLVVREDIAVYLMSAVRHRVYKSTRHFRVVSRFIEVVNQAGHNVFDKKDDADVAADLDTDRIRTAISKALESLSERERAALLLRWGEGRTYQEIGTILGLSSMGVHKMVLRAINRVRPLLERYRDYAG